MVAISQMISLRAYICSKDIHGNINDNIYIWRWRPLDMEPFECTTTCVEIMTWHQIGHKPLSSSIMIQFPNILSSLWYKTHFSRQLNCWSLRCSWSIACRRCSNYIFILNLTPGFNGLGKDNYKMRREAFKFWDLVRLILETLRYIHELIDA